MTSRSPVQHSPVSGFISRLPARHAETIDGYRSFAAAGLTLAVLRDQVQAENAVRNGLPRDQLIYFDEYDDALSAVLDGRAGGYASVALAHREHLATDPSLADLAVVTVPDQEVPPATGAFACASPATRDALNIALNDLLGEATPDEPSPDSASWPSA
ncbi:transporter substrate-binding domain-containing protein [Aeromicrobium fastidiosum]|uniref:transporter substrate-binding domain-containing protein n=1 Tax=Aeromicrobium fastidiosum TaxID=52699 RepID=UPI0027DD4E62|nr:transporter substrate-binding domain-containing protein [Aeromicrobium fastidiosum]